jgi:hypothetical protein
LIIKKKVVREDETERFVFIVLACGSALLSQAHQNQKVFVSLPFIKQAASVKKTKKTHFLSVDTLMMSVT